MHPDHAGAGVVGGGGTVRLGARGRPAGTRRPCSGSRTRPSSTSGGGPPASHPGTGRGSRAPGRSAAAPAARSRAGPPRPRRSARGPRAACQPPAAWHSTGTPASMRRTGRSGPATIQSLTHPNGSAGHPARRHDGRDRVNRWPRAGPAPRRRSHRPRPAPRGTGLAPRHGGRHRPPPRPGRPAACSQAAKSSGPCRYSAARSPGRPARFRRVFTKSRLGRPPYQTQRRPETS